MSEPLVTVCIPTWRSEAFIDRTLKHARSQSHRNLRILISIDQSDDRTEEICQRHAADDGRVEVQTHDTRLGWARNVNHLLDNVESEYFFLFMHDDIIDSRYVEMLLSRLRDSPDAASAQCDVLNVYPNGKQLLSRGRPQEGNVSERFVASLVDPLVGAPLRALIRTEAVLPRVRFPLTSLHGFDSQVPFQASLFAAGLALHVPAILYWRPTARKGGLVDGWSAVPMRSLIADQQGNARQCLDVISASRANSSETTVMTFALYLRLLTSIRSREVRQGGPALVEPTAIAPEFEFDGIPSGIVDFPRHIQRALRGGYMNLIRRETLYYLRQRGVENTFSSLKRITMRDAVVGIPAVAWRYTRRMWPRVRPFEVPPDLRSSLQDQ